MQQHILFGVLNWGLGHATRSTVVIDALLEQNFKVTIASDGESLRWLKGEYPDMHFLKLPSYSVRYSRLGWFNFKMLVQLPQIARAISAERRKVRRYVVQNKVMGIISDNRLGCWHPEIPCAYISHQLNLKAGIFSKTASALHQRYINKFAECWIPDFDDHRLSGELSPIDDLTVPCRFLGPLSRLDPRKLKMRDKQYVLAILSGPEPQRTMLEKKLLKQMGKLTKEKFKIVGGKEKAPAKLPDNVRRHSTVGTRQLAKQMSKAKYIISRSGYSSLMDYYRMGLNALLIPTPGQGEQEYLAEFHQKKKRFHSVAQQDLHLPYDLDKTKEYKGFATHESPGQVDWKKLFSLFQRKGKG